MLRYLVKLADGVADLPDAGTLLLARRRDFRDEIIYLRHSTGKVVDRFAPCATSEHA